MAAGGGPWLGVACEQGYRAAEPRVLAWMLETVSRRLCPERVQARPQLLEEGASSIGVGYVASMEPLQAAARKQKKPERLRKSGGGLG
jgi:hypothetical protein